MSEELFIEKNINWLRLRDVTLATQLPERIRRANAERVRHGHRPVPAHQLHRPRSDRRTATTAAVGGSGGVGIDFGNFPMPRGLNFGFKMGF